MRKPVKKQPWISGTPGRCKTQKLATFKTGTATSWLWPCWVFRTRVTATYTCSITSMATTTLPTGKLLAQSLVTTMTRQLANGLVQPCLTLTVQSNCSMLTSLPKKVAIKELPLSPSTSARMLMVSISRILKTTIFSLLVTALFIKPMNSGRTVRATIHRCVTAIFLRTATALTTWLLKLLLVTSAMIQKVPTTYMTGADMAATLLTM